LSAATDVVCADAGLENASTVPTAAAGMLSRIHNLVFLLLAFNSLAFLLRVK
jgi:hypothetical protein